MQENGLRDLLGTLIIRMGRFSFSLVLEYLCWNFFPMNSLLYIHICLTKKRVTTFIVNVNL
jgi:hypothetical protein